MNEELRDDYAFDYRQAKPNRSAAADKVGNRPRPSGLAKGHFVVPGDFDVPLPDEVLREFEQRARHALSTLSDCVEIDPKKLGGVPVLANSRFSVAQLFGELADSDAIAEIADNFEVDLELLRRFLHAFAVCIDQPPK
ncbi:MAG TPA: DUF433 domain-containing protein [Gemmataceae bacterium]|nr:DUF433 domain-containing protein [Gemmataceae bacterium]